MIQFCLWLKAEAIGRFCRKRGMANEKCQILSIGLTAAIDGTSMKHRDDFVT